MRERWSGQNGQASPEWIGLVLVVALILAALAAAGVSPPGTDLARTVAARIVCAAGLGGSRCADGDSDLFLAYGPELAALVREHAPEIRYEDGMRALPVDFRSCREDACAEGAETGEVFESLSGEAATAFVRVIDCREGGAGPESDSCAGDRSGHVYVQYWLYYPGSQTLRRILGDRGFHDDDFESFQVRIGSGGAAEARATSHHGYNYRGGPGSWLSDLGKVKRSAWGPDLGTYYVSGGSHAGKVSGDEERGRWTAPDAIRLIPLETLADQSDRWSFSDAVKAPWVKRVYGDPESTDT